MKIFILLISVAIILTFSCKDDKCIETNVCNLTGPIDEVPWIAELKKTMTKCSCEISLIKGTYNGQVVIFIAFTDPLCDGINTPTLYNCEGKS